MRDGIPARRVLRLLSAGLALVASTGTAVGQSFEPELELADLLAANGGDGTVGFALNGVRRLEVAGTSVAGTGDVNGDGIDDVTIGARGANPNGTGSGRAYVVFGTDEGFPAELELADLLAANGGDGTQGFVLNGVADSDQAGQTVAGMGDINGDGIDDVLLNAPFADPNGTSSGQVYVVFGTDTGFPAELELSDLLAANGGDGTQGFALNGAAFDQAGYSIAWARDINDDGIDDILIGAPFADPNGNLSGQACVVFGADDGFPAELELADLLAANGGDGTRGFVLNGAAEGDIAGVGVAGVGDVNGDGVDDLMIGAPFNGTNVGHAYVVFGTDEGFPAELELADLLAANGGDGTDGFALNGVPVETGIESAGARVGGTGDINDDGIGDLIVGASAVFQSGLPDQAYVVFGTDEGFPAELELADLLAANGGDGTRGFALNGALEVAAAGDVDSDGIDDLILGAGGADPNGINSGRAYVVFGTNEGFPAELELSDLLAVNGGDGTLGFALNGAAEGEVTGTSVAGAGDIDDDGIDDLIIGASNADPNGINSGRAYVVFGRGPEAAIERLIARVEAAGLPGGIENSLVSKLDSALGLLARDNTTGAISKLGDFMDQVEAQRGKQIDEGDADAWIADAQAILDALRTA